MSRLRPVASTRWSCSGASGSSRRTNHRPPPPIVERIGEIAPRSVFLIYTEPGSGREDVRQPNY
jgi:hypothetical protein